MDLELAPVGLGERGERRLVAGRCGGDKGGFVRSALAGSGLLVRGCLSSPG
jgi:hypothetical protein